MRSDAAELLVRRTTFVVASLAFGVVLAALLLFLAHHYRSLFTSDDAVVNLLAQSMWEQGRLLPSHWINNNGDLMIPSGAMIVAPLLRWFPNGYGVHAVAGVFAALLLIGSLVGLLRVLKMPAPVILLTATLAASGLSLNNIIMVFAQTTYVWWSAGFMLGAALVFALNSGVARPMLGAMALFALVFSISFGNPLRVGLMMIFPLYLLDRTLTRWGTRAPDGRVNRSTLGNWLGVREMPVVAVAAGFAAAFATYLLLAILGITEASFNAAALHWGGTESVLRHAATFAHWLDYLGGSINPLEMGASSFRGLSGVRQGIAVALTVIGIVEMARIPWQQDVARRALAVALAGAFFPILAVYLIFEPLAVDGGTLRYFTVAIYIAMVLSAFVLRDLLRISERFGRSFMTACGVLLVPISLQHYVPVSQWGTPEFWSLAPSPQMQLAGLLQKEGLTRGYSTYATAGATTVQTDSRIRVSPVVVGETGIAPFPYMVSKDWYRSGHAETFLALTKQEATPKLLDQIRTHLGEPQREIDAASWHILVYACDVGSGAIPADGCR